MALDAGLDASGTGIAVVIPCHNEGGTIGKVVTDFRRALPGARIIVVDNASSDGTREAASSAGAEVLSESRRGKGFALLTGFEATVDADAIVMVDGDDTYPAEDVSRLLAAIDDGADMAIGTRLETPDADAFPKGHNTGNRLFNFLVRMLFGIRTRDLLSGYRVLSRRFLTISPLIAQGFEVETELALQALARGFRVMEVPVRYRARPRGTASKLRTITDGYRILLALVAFLRDYRPLTFFGTLAILFGIGSLTSGGVVISEYAATGQVLRLPLAVLSVGLFLLAALCALAGLILSSLARRSAELSALLARRG
ncbi:MAG: glycosyltransferase family 2 protein [Gemmatimonadetes bacterium]|nr:glycosyltransferase family 2 protein [Gemmatimonadota bacterium]